MRKNFFKQLCSVALIGILFLAPPLNRVVLAEEIIYDKLIEEDTTLVNDWRATTESETELITVAMEELDTEEQSEMESGEIVPETPMTESSEFDDTEIGIVPEEILPEETISTESTDLYEDLISEDDGFIISCEEIVQNSEVSLETELGFERVKPVDDEILSSDEYEYRILEDSTVEIVKYIGGEVENLEIPNSIDGYVVSVIGEEAFSYRKDIKGTLKLPESLKVIGDYAFASCNGFNGTITLPSTLTSIGTHAFDCCNNFSGNLVLPQSLTVIGSYAFYECSGLDGGLLLPSFLKYLGSSAFEGCSFTGGLSIPDTLTYIDSHVFARCKFNGGLSLPSTLVFIGSGAFLMCDGLNGQLALPDSLLRLDSDAFAFCSGFTGKLILPNKLASIGQGAFWGCKGFSGELNIPDSITNIGNNAFRDCTGFNGGLVLSSKLKSLGTDAFSGCSGFSGELHLPDSLTNIGTTPFADCNFDDMDKGALRYYILEDGSAEITGYVELSKREDSITIPSSIDGHVVSSIGDHAFSGMSCEFVLPSTVTNIGEYAFYQCKWPKGTFMLPSSLKTIGDYAFHECSGFSGAFVLPSSLKTIGNHAFCCCDEFTGSLLLPASLESIGDSAFSRWCGGNNKSDSGFSGELILPSSLVTIGDYAFSYCTGLKGNLTLPSSLISIGNYAFYNCTGLSGEVELPAGLKELSETAFVECNVTITGYENYYGNYEGFSYRLLKDGTVEITDYTEKKDISRIPERINGYTVSSIGDYAFVSCGFNGHLILPSSLTHIGDSAFYPCHGLSGELKFPDGLVYIGEGAFAECSGFSGNLVFPNTVEEIGDCAFLMCDGFDGKLVLPNSLKNIGDCAFYGCSGLKGELILPASLKSIGTMKGYSFKDSLVRGTFGHCTGFTGNLTLPDNLECIGVGAFGGCTGFTGKLNLPDSLKYIGWGAFMKCTGFDGELKLPESLQSLDGGAFSECTGFQGEVELPESLIKFGSNVFSGCSVTVVGRRKRITVTFDSNGGSELTSQSVVVGKCVTEPQPPIWNGYQFLGWFLNDTLFDFDTPITSNITLIAKWEEKQETEETGMPPQTEPQTQEQTEPQSSLTDQDTPNNDAGKQPSKEHVHDWGEWIVASEATVFQPQKQQRICNLCSDEEIISVGTKVIPTIKVNATTVPLKVKQSTTKVKVTDLAAGDYVKSWKSSNPKIVTVDRNGKITAKKKVGKAIITITLASGLKEKIVIKVQKATVRTKKISVKTKNIRLKRGQKYSLVATVNPITSLQKVSYKVTNKKIATVSKKGVIKAVKSGRTKITVSSGSKKVIVNVIVKNK